jgi:tetratricopeptide (TPR) repeat protein
LNPPFWLALAGVAVALALTQGSMLVARLRLNLALVQYARSLLNDPAGHAAASAHQSLLEAYEQAPAVPPSTRYRVLPVLISGSAPAVPAICPPSGERFHFLQLLTRARDLVQAQQLQQAETLYAWLAANCPDSFEVLVDWAVLKEAQGDYAAGVGLLETAVSLEPQFRPASSIDQPPAYWRGFAVAEAYADLADLLAKNGQLERALVTLEHAIALHPPGTHSPWQYQYLGFLYYQAGQLDKAKQAFQSALALEPNLPDSLTYLQWIKNRQPAPP